MANLLLVILGVLGISGSDPSALVRRLGAPKYADREAASSEIEKLGSDALPALRAARSASDAEIRSRAVALVERIESDLMARSTAVLLDFRDEPLGQVVAKLAERGRANLVLSPSAASLRDQRITLVRPEPVSFWEAVDLVGNAGGVELSGGMPLGGPGHITATSTSLTLIPSPHGSKAAPVSVSGPFRVTLLNIIHNKRRTFGGNLGIAPMELGQMPQDGDGEQFYAGLQVLSEPRMTVALNGQPRLIVAEDDRGNSLLAGEAVNNGFLRISGYNQYQAAGTTAVQMTLGMKFPERAGRTIKTLRGVIPVTITARKGDPLMIPLAEAKGKSYHNADTALTIHDVKHGIQFPQTIIDLTIRGSQAAEPNFNGLLPNMPGARGSGLGQSPFEIVDAQGRMLGQSDTLSQMQTPDGLRMSIRFIQAVNGPATHLRYYEFNRVTTDAEFLFRDVDMP
jgi:hypothetical protein